MRRSSLPLPAEMPFEIPLDDMIREIKRKRAKRVFIQAPEGIKPYVAREVPLIEERSGASIVLHGDPTYGGCDLASCESARVESELVIHLGHTPFGPLKEDYAFFDIRARVDIDEDLIRQLAPLVRGKTVGLLAPLHYVHLIP